MEGLDLGKFAPGEREVLEMAASKYISSGHLYLEGEHLKLSKEGKLLADGIAATLFF